jgi:hypothetical protein
VRKIHRLTPLKIRSLKTPGRYADGGGLELQVSKSLTKSWLFRYATLGQEHRVGLGSIHTINLQEARLRARQCRQQILDGQDPLALKREARADAAGVMTFRECADAFLKAKLRDFRSAKHRQQWASTLEDAHRLIGSMPVNNIDTAAVLRVLRPMWDQTPETASRLRIIAAASLKDSNCLIYVECRIALPRNRSAASLKQHSV